MGLGYAENDWILREVQERSSLAFRYAIDHSPLTTWRLVKPGGAGGGLETSKSRPNERKNIFSSKWLTTVQQKGGARLSHERKKGEVSRHIKRGGAGAALMSLKWVFLHRDAWHPIFPPRHKRVDSIHFAMPFSLCDVVTSVFSSLDLRHLLGPQVTVLRWKTPPT